MTFHPLPLLIIVSCCLVLGGLVPMLCQPFLGWPLALTCTGWCSVAVLLIAVGLAW